MRAYYVLNERTYRDVQRLGMLDSTKLIIRLLTVLDNDKSIQNDCVLPNYCRSW